MAKVKKQKTRDPKVKVEKVMFTENLEELPIKFPKVKVTKYSQQHPGEAPKAGKDIIVDITLPKDYTLVSKCVAASGEYTKIAFKTSAKSGVYVFC